MHACGVVVEYNPFHYGHLYHLQESKRISHADCMIAVMSGNFLQRGEPAIVDKFARTKMAIDQGVDIVIELPYSYAVQHSDLFSFGAIQLLNALQVSSICFGSEEGSIDSFKNTFEHYQNHEELFKETIKQSLSLGYAYPVANNQAFKAINVDKADSIDITKPNNILGLSYLKAIKAVNSTITPFTIKRKQSDYHEQQIKQPYASATSIRKHLLQTNIIDTTVKDVLSDSTIQQLEFYQKTAGIWHTWECYFPLLQYRVLTTDHKVLSLIQGVDEGIEHRLIKTAKKATSFDHWMSLLKTKRYTQARLQRIFTHILTNTMKDDIQMIQQHPLSTIRLLGMSKQGKAYLHHTKKQRDTPIITQFKKPSSLLMKVEERATDAYYSILNPEVRKQLRHQEFQAPYQKS